MLSVTGNVPVCESNTIIYLFILESNTTVSPNTLMCDCLCKNPFVYFLYKYTSNQIYVQKLFI